MKHEIDLNFAPENYFKKISLETRLKSKITGQLRKKEIVASSKSKFTAPYALKGKITTKERAVQSQLHPRNMGGEYLSDLNSNETEICRIVLESTMLDVTSMRVKFENERYVYFVEDEYEQFDYALPIATSLQTLTTEQIIQQIDDCIVTEKGNEPGDAFKGLMSPVLTTHLDGGCPPRDLIDYITVESSFYPDLTKYYKTKLTKYLMNLT